MQNDLKYYGIKVKLKAIREVLEAGRGSRSDRGNGLLLEGSGSGEHGIGAGCDEVSGLLGKRGYCLLCLELVQSPTPSS